MLIRLNYIAYFLCAVSAFSLLLDTEGAEELPALTVMGQETANQRPVTTYETPISNLDFDPRVDMQSRNMAEAQGDLSIRGGTFENSGIQVGSATLLDPQTGHYTTELPIAPEMLAEPKVLTGADNALRGFNCTVGTVAYSWSEITPRGSLTVGGGDHDLNFQRIHHALTGAYANSKDWTWGAEIEGSRSESDGTIPLSDHSFARTSGRVQLRGPNSQTDLFAGYQHKLFGQYGMYTGDLYTAFNPFEFENIKTRLFLFNHRQEYGEQSSFETSLYHRSNSDHYLFNRFAPNQNFVHDTEVNSFSSMGRHELGSKVAINYGFQASADEIESSALENGAFTSRNYYKLTILPEYLQELAEKESLIIKGGVSWYDTNRDKAKMSPIAEISVFSEDSSVHWDRSYISYSESVQFIGYGAIGGSESSGLFRSNYDLRVEKSKNLELGHQLKRSEWSLNTAVFYRWDDNLVDWAYVGSGARSAENVDIETFGFEVFVSRQWNRFETIASYTFLEKEEDYGNLAIDGSFYALNYPEHRATLGIIWNPTDILQIRMDNEWRDQRENALRKGPDHSIYSHLAASYYPSVFNDLEVFIAYDKPWDEDFQ
ncbi:MAG: TonB-dependent receptor, partial [Opitutae bacterium]